MVAGLELAVATSRQQALLPTDNLAVVAWGERPISRVLQQCTQAAAVAPRQHPVQGVVAVWGAQVVVELVHAMDRALWLVPPTRVVVVVVVNRRSVVAVAQAL